MLTTPSVRRFKVNCPWHSKHVCILIQVVDLYLALWNPKCSGGINLKKTILANFFKIHLVMIENSCHIIAASLNVSVNVRKGGHFVSAHTFTHSHFPFTSECNTDSLALNYGRLATAFPRLPPLENVPFRIIYLTHAAGAVNPSRLSQGNLEYVRSIWLADWIMRVLCAGLSMWLHINEVVLLMPKWSDVWMHRGLVLV